MSYKAATSTICFLESFLIHGTNQHLASFLYSREQSFYFTLMLHSFNTSTVEVEEKKKDEGKQC